MVGFIYVTREKVQQEYGWKRLTQKRIKQIQQHLESEVATYSQYLEGDVWGFSLIEETKCCQCHQTITDILDSCWGFYGHNPKTNGMADHIPDLDQYEIVYE